jgi:DnaK suppressor protein
MAESTRKTARPADAGEGPQAGGRTTTVMAEGGSVPPVRAGEDPWSPQELEDLRQELTAEHARLTTEVTSLQASLDEVLRDGGDGAGDDHADTGSKAFEREHELTLLSTVRETAFQTELALRRLDDGSYGTCEGCGQAVGKLRLQAFPRASLCVGCKQRQERR